MAQGVDWSSMGAMALRIVAVLLCLVVHEVCHGLLAYWLGDPTAKQSHRLSLQSHSPSGPLWPAHDGGGGVWLGQARAGGPPLLPQAQAGYGHHQALAGPVSNFLLAYVSAILYSGLYAVLVVRGRPRGWPWHWSFSAYW